MRISDWSSDVCSSDLVVIIEPRRIGTEPGETRRLDLHIAQPIARGEIDRPGARRERRADVKSVDLRHIVDLRPVEPCRRPTNIRSRPRRQRATLYRQRLPNLDRGPRDPLMDVVVADVPVPRSEVRPLGKEGSSAGSSRE